MNYDNENRVINEEVSLRSACPTGRLCEGCQVGCENKCELGCQNKCQKACQSGCQLYCMNNCELGCEACQCTAEGCETCQCTVEGCETCQCTAEGCETCQCIAEGCESCQCKFEGCQNECEYDCECKDEGCQNECEYDCECKDEGCQNECEYDCECKFEGCKNHCQNYCQCSTQGCRCSTQGCQSCQNNCECSVEGCQSCQSTDVDVDISNVENESFTVQIGDLEYSANQYDRFIIKVISGGSTVKNLSFTSSSSSKSISKTISGLTPGTHYEVIVEICWHDKWYSPGSVYVDTTIVLSSFSLSNITANSVRVNIHDLQYSASQYDKFIVIYSGEEEEYEVNSSSHDISLTLVGLEPKTNYTIQVKASYNNKLYAVDVNNSEKSITTKHVDLEIVDIDYKGSCYTDKSNRISVTVRNGGNTTSSQTELSIGTDLKNDNGWSMEVISSRTIESLQPSESVNKVFYIESSKASTIDYAVVADTGELNEDSDYGNNAIVFSVKWKRRSPSGSYSNISQKYYDYLKYGAYGINPGSGNFSDTFTDMSVAAPGFELNMTRTYNSGDDRVEKRPFGKGWSFGFEGFFSQEDNAVTMPNGSIQTFDKNGDVYTAKDSRSKLIKNEDGSHTLSTKDQYTYKFNSSGYLYQMTDRNGNSIIIEFDSDNKIIGIRDQADKHYTITYENDSITKIKEDGTSRFILYGYTNNNLAYVVKPNGCYERYEYDSYGYLSKIKDHNNNVVSAITYNHTSSEYQHTVNSIADRFGNTRIYSYNKTERKTTITDSNGKTEIKWYDMSNNITKIQKTNGQIEIYEYFMNGDENKYSEIKTKTDRKGNKTVFERDETGNVTKQINPDGSFKIFEYDNKNNVIKEVDESANSIYYIYDENELNLMKRIQPLNGTDEYSDTANQDDFAITTYEYYTQEESQNLEYNEKGLIKSVTDPDGSKNVFTYDASGNKILAVDDTQHSIAYEYDNLGRKTAEVSTTGIRTEYIYDENDLVLKETRIFEQESSVKLFEFDEEGRKVKEITPNLYDETYETENHKYSQMVGYRYEYYASGKLKQETDTEDNITKYTYDIYGNRVTMELPSGGIFEYEYDGLNRQTKKFYKETVDSDKKLLQESIYTVLSNKTEQITEKKYYNETDYSQIQKIYDYANRLIKTIYPDGGVETRQYNSNGTLKQFKNKTDHITYYKYDGLSRLVEKWIPASEETGVIKYRYNKTKYNKDSSVHQELVGRELVEYPNKPTTYITKTKEYYSHGKVKREYNSGGQSKEYWYDLDLRLIKELIKISDNQDKIIDYEYNYQNKVTKKKEYVRRGDIYPNAIDLEGQVNISTVYEYDKNGNVIRATDANGVTISYSYDNMNRLVENVVPAKDENDNDIEIVITKEYNSIGKLTAEIDGMGNKIINEYDNRGNLIKSSNQMQAVTAYYYDLAGRKTAIVSPESYKEDTSLEQLNRTELKYDNNDKLIAEIAVFKEKRFQTSPSEQWIETWTSNIQKAYQYDLEGNKIKELDGESYDRAEGGNLEEKIQNGEDIEYSYDISGNVISVLDKVAKAASKTFTNKYSYDALGRTISEENVKGQIVSYEYDENNYLTSKKVTINGQEVTLEAYTYDKLGNVLTKTDANGNTITYEYNMLGKVSKEIQPGDSSIEILTVNYQYDKLGNVRNITNSAGKQQIIEYDNLNRVIKEIEQRIDGTEKIVKEKKYDRNSNIIVEIDPNGAVVEKVYDQVNRLINQTITVNKGLEDEFVDCMTYKYDKNNNQTKQTDRIGNTITKKYDALNRVIEIRNQYDIAIEKFEYTKTNKQSKSYDANNNVKSYEYDANERVTKIIDQEGNETIQEYDLLGNISKVIDPNGNTTEYTYDVLNRLQSVKNALGEITSYKYDNNSNIISKIDAKGNEESVEYNCRNLPVRKIAAGGKTIENNEIVYDENKIDKFSYYADGTISSKTDKNKIQVIYQYDVHGNVLLKISDGISHSYTYDNNGNLLTVLDSTGRTEKTYDEKNRIVAENNPKTGTIAYKYDIIEVTTGQIKQIVTDSLGNSTYTVFDKAKRIKMVSADNKLTVNEYNKNGSLKKVTYQNGSTQEYEYYKNNKLKKLTNKKSSGEIIDSYEYTYDKAGNQLTVVDAKGTTSYEYDGLNRIIRVTKPNGASIEYQYDEVGNRVKQINTENGQTIISTYTYDEQNRLITLEKQQTNGNTVQTKYVYDNNGNLLKEESSEGIKTLEYDKLNRTIRVNKDGDITDYIYNGENKRVGKTTAKQQKRYLYSGNKVILETDEEGQELSKNIYAHKLIQRSIGEKTVNYMYNGHGDVTALIDTENEITDKYYYDEFGNHEEKTGETDNPYRYGGYEYDEETNYYYLRARYYDSKIARFTSEDTYQGNIKDPLSLNRYTYCSNNPLIYIDPTGHMRMRLNDDYAASIESQLKRGSKGEAVRELQNNLNVLGYKVKVNGKFGKETEEAVRKFLIENCNSIEGLLEPKTYAKISGEEGKLTASLDIKNTKKESSSIVQKQDNTEMYKLLGIALTKTNLYTARLGGYVHKEIQKDFKKIFPENGSDEYYIKRGVSHTKSGTGYADMILSFKNYSEVYEIKPIHHKNAKKGTYELLGRDQLQNYINAINLYPQDHENKVAVKGTIYKPNSIIPHNTNPNKEIVIEHNYVVDPGMIYYYVRNQRQKQPSTVPVPVPSNAVIPKSEKKSRWSKKEKAIGYAIILGEMGKALDRELEFRPVR